MANHYDPSIDGTPPVSTRKLGLAPAGVEDEVDDGKGLYSRKQLLYQVVGPIDPSAVTGLGKFDLSQTDEVPVEIRRVWPDEPNVGFAENDMSFLIDAALRIGGPTLKTYDLNRISAVSAVQESRLYHDSTLQQLRGSENASEVADVFRQVCSASASADASGAGLYGFDSVDIENDDYYTFSLLDSTNDTITLRRPGTYHVVGSLSAESDAILGYSEVELLLNGSAYRTVSFQWNCYIDAMIKVETTDTDTVQFDLTVGATRMGTLRRSYVSVTKLR